MLEIGQIRAGKTSPGSDWLCQWLREMLLPPRQISILPEEQSKSGIQIIKDFLFCIHLPLIIYPETLQICQELEQQTHYIIKSILIKNLSQPGLYWRDLFIRDNNLCERNPSSCL